MLLNDVTRNDKMNGVHTRDLQNAVVRHHKNNPHVSREAAFEYIMSISSTYRALPVECTDKARRYLALPISSNEKGNPDMPGIFIIPDDIPFNVGCIPIKWKSGTSPFDHNDPCDPSIVGPKEQTKPGTTVVHAERVVVDNKKMILILEFENVKELIDLPTDYYMSTFPYYFRSHLVYLRVCTSKGIERSFAKGDIVSIENFDQMIKTMKEAAARLAEINKTAKLEKEHSGKFMVSI